MARQDENVGFACARCGAAVRPLNNGSYRNHCPECLWSLHVDGVRPGDRSSRCRGLMAPVGVSYSRKGYQIEHRCTRCGAVRRNVAAFDTDQGDFEAVLRLMRR